jgi:hypothetical protein
MSAIATAIVGGAALGAYASREASETAAEGVQAGISAEERQADIAREDIAPWREAGGRALTTLEGELEGPISPDMAGFEGMPGYKFRLSQGMQALDRSAAARGGVGGGGHKASILDYAQGSASQEYDKEYGRRYGARSDYLNRLAAMAGLGQTATTAGAGLGAGSAARIAGGYRDIGTAGAAGTMGTAQAITGGINQGLWAYGSGMFDRGSSAPSSWKGPDGLNIMNPTG